MEQNIVDLYKSLSNIQQDLQKISPLIDVCKAESKPDNSEKFNKLKTTIDIINKYIIDVLKFLSTSSAKNIQSSSSEIIDILSYLSKNFNLMMMNVDSLKNSFIIVKESENQNIYTPQMSLQQSLQQSGLQQSGLQQQMPPNISEMQSKVRSSENNIGSNFPQLPVSDVSLPKLSDLKLQDKLQDEPLSTKNKFRERLSHLY